MPRFRRNRTNPQPGDSFPVQDNDNTIPFYNARMFSMYENLIQSYTHFTYHANCIYNMLGQTLNGTWNSNYPPPVSLVHYPQYRLPATAVSTPASNPASNPATAAVSCSTATATSTTTTTATITATITATANISEP